MACSVRLTAQGALSARDQGRAQTGKPLGGEATGGGVIIRLRLFSPGSDSPNHDGVSELNRRGYVPQSLYCLAGASNGERTEAKDPTEN